MVPFSLPSLLMPVLVLVPVVVFVLGACPYTWTLIRNPLIPAHNVLRAVGRAADRDAKHRHFLLRMQVCFWGLLGPYALVR